MTEKSAQLPVRRTVQTLLQANKASLQAALPKHITPDRMIRVVMTALTTTPLLEKCTVPSILKAVIQSSQLGLEPDGQLGYAYLIPYKNKATGQYEAQLIVGYRGYLALARRSGQLRSLDVDVIYEKDHFQYLKGTEPRLEHRPSLTEDRGNPIGSYACARLTDGGVQFEVLPMAQIAKSQGCSKATGQQSAWKTHWDAMAKKTAIRQLAKYLPLSVEFVQAAVREEYLEQGVDPGDITVEADMGALMAAATATKTEELREKYKKEDKEAAGNASSVSPSDMQSPGSGEEACEPGWAG